MTASKYPVVVAITGASGAVYAIRLLQSLLRSQVEVHLTVSPSGAAVIEQETGFNFDLKAPDLVAFVSQVPIWSTEKRRADIVAVDWASLVRERLNYHHYENYFTPIASGSFRTSAMVVCPCSGSTLSSIAHAASNNLISRAAEVHLKEQRKLILVPRETPLSVLQLENMHRLATAGVTILPAMPGWYHGVESLDCLVDFVVARLLDQLQIDNQLIERWKDTDG
ncbi:UbiX family flavin prenyltransferase [Stieleria sp. JC731]|uniref:UbiX family flavin prenyltransferase n=1 Tax=Pirellulaceae TaxID=2691357 RepID=UPI001E55E3BA|nr:flavin prenyltransferase UbiX [Stieleria sp. JC731]MCC9601622.1 UbiX family flavin prenyltransferase [Stieleria sp. JC731]